MSEDVKNYIMSQEKFVKVFMMGENGLSKL